MRYRRRKLWWDFIVRAEEDAGGGDPGGDAGTGDNADAGQGGASGGDGSAVGGQGDADSGQDKGDEQAKGYWPDDWLNRVSKGDEKLSKRLGRYASPEAMADALVAAQNRISSGELKTALPENASEAELSQWRKENGIPESPDKYDLKFDSGLIIGEEDKPLVDSYLEAAHKDNTTPEQAKNTIEWFFKWQDKMGAEREAEDDTDTQLVQDELNVEWGASYRRNINMIQGLMDKIPEDSRKALMAARLPDGKAIFNDAGVLRGLAAIALEVDPAGTLVPGGGGDPMKGVDEEIASIETTMRENRGKYNKDEKMQARYRELIDAREKLKKRSA